MLDYAKIYYERKNCMDKNNYWASNLGTTNQANRSLGVVLLAHHGVVWLCDAALGSAEGTQTRTRVPQTGSNSGELQR